MWPNSPARNRGHPRFCLYIVHFFASRCKAVARKGFRKSPENVSEKCRKMFPKRSPESSTKGRRRDPPKVAEKIHPRYQKRSKTSSKPVPQMRRASWINFGDRIFPGLGTRVPHRGTGLFEHILLFLRAFFCPTVSYVHLGGVPVLRSQPAKRGGAAPKKNLASEKEIFFSLPEGEKGKGKGRKKHSGAPRARGVSRAGAPLCFFLPFPFPFSPFGEEKNISFSDALVKGFQYFYGGAAAGGGGGAAAGGGAGGAAARRAGRCFLPIVRTGGKRVPTSGRRRSWSSSWFSGVARGTPGGASPNSQLCVVARHATGARWLHARGWSRRRRLSGNYMGALGLPPELLFWRRRGALGLAQVDACSRARPCVVGSRCVAFLASASAGYPGSQP